MTTFEAKVTGFYDNLVASGKLMAKDTRFWQKEFVRLTKNQPIFFDLGCGDGREALLYREIIGNLGQYYGLDLSSGMLDFTKSHSPEAKLVQASFSHLPFADNSLPTVWATASYLHIDHEQIKPTLAELFRVMTQGGRGFISLKSNPQNKPDYNQHLVTYYKIGEFWNLLTQAGFFVNEASSDAIRDSRGVTWLGYFFSKPQ